MRIHWVVHLRFVYFSLLVFPWKAYAKFLSKRPYMTMTLPLPSPHYFFLFPFFLAALCSMRNLRSLTRDWTHTSCSGNLVKTTGPPEKSLPSPHFWLHPNFAHSIRILFSNTHCWLLLVWGFCISKSLCFQTSTQPIPSPNSSLIQADLNFCLSENSPSTNLCKITSSTTFVSLPFFIFPKYLPLSYVLWISFFIHLLSF